MDDDNDDDDGDIDEDNLGNNDQDIDNVGNDVDDENHDDNDKHEQDVMLMMSTRITRTSRAWLHLSQFHHFIIIILRWFIRRLTTRKNVFI